MPVETVSIAAEARKRFIRYAMSVVMGRALPDVRDGLKPVQRRILYTHVSGPEPDVRPQGRAKSAQIVGEVMGNYHPHGDVALYDALVRLAQDWVMRVPLVHGEGNFGSVDGDPPAAHRYTEAKLTARRRELCSPNSIRRPSTIRDNYTGTKQEPVVLPAQFPNLLVNGTSGIAVGMATNIPPHNLGEVLRACILLIENPDATRRAAAGQGERPGLPARRQDRHRPRHPPQDLRRRARGSIKVQGEWKEEKLDKGKSQIVITSIPYGVDKGQLEASDRRHHRRRRDCRNSSASRTNRTRRTACGSSWNSSRHRSRIW